MYLKIIHLNKIYKVFQLVVFKVSCSNSIVEKKAVLNMLSANKSWSIHKRFRSDLRALQVVSDSPGLVNFLIGLVNSVLNLPNRQMNFT